MSAPASRRGFLSGLAVLPSLTVVATAAASPDAPLLDLAPRLVPLLDRYDRLWAAQGGTYEAGIAEVQRATRRGASWGEAQSASPLWRKYMSARAPADRIGDIIDPLIEPLWDHRAVTVPGLLLKARIAATFDSWEGDVFDDVRAMVKAGTLLT
jgi:hypothetical protein